VRFATALTETEGAVRVCGKIPKAAGHVHASPRRKRAPAERAAATAGRPAGRVYDRPMGGPQKRTEAEAWRALESTAAAENDDGALDEADEKELARITALSDEELDKELAAAGIDPDSVRTKGSEIATQLRERDQPKAVPIRPRRLSGRTTAILLAAALAVLLLGLLGWAIGRGHH
jgi:hypothetical protein